MKVSEASKLSAANQPPPNIEPLLHVLYRAIREACEKGDNSVCSPLCPEVHKNPEIDIAAAYAQLREDGLTVVDHRRPQDETGPEALVSISWPTKVPHMVPKCCPVGDEVMISWKGRTIFCQVPTDLHEQFAEDLCEAPSVKSITYPGQFPEMIRCRKTSRPTTAITEPVP